MEHIPVRCVQHHTLRKFACCAVVRSLQQRVPMAHFAAQRLAFPKNETSGGILMQMAT
jgi:hypothetical protein